MNRYIEFEVLTDYCPEYVPSFNLDSMSPIPQVVSLVGLLPGSPAASGYERNCLGFGHIVCES